LILLLRSFLLLIDILRDATVHTLRDQVLLILAHESCSSHTGGPVLELCGLLLLVGRLCLVHGLLGVVHWHLLSLWEIHVLLGLVAIWE
jgi:hypothetical protein